jgi:tRNA U34 2-thiouridine synthase MnmA/TrmU
MNVHKNARLTPRGRERIAHLVESGQPPKAVAEAAGVCPRLGPSEPVRRYEREHPGEMIHLDIKKLGRIDGIGHRITGDRRGQSI